MRLSYRIVSYRTLLLPQSTGPTSHASHTKVHGADRDHSAGMCSERVVPASSGQQARVQRARDPGMVVCGSICMWVTVYTSTRSGLGAAFGAAFGAA